MIQLNLLPDVKLHFIKAQRQKQLVISVSILVIIISLVVLAFLIVTAQLVQTKSINDLTTDIKASSDNLADTSDLNKILTVQNQLNTLPGLHDQKVVSSRLFSILQKVTPTSADINSLTIDFDATTLSITGKADSLETVNQYVDALKLTAYTTTEDATERLAFQGVVLTSFNRNADGANYLIDMTFDTIIFSVTEEPELKVPSGHSSIINGNRPLDDLFQQRDLEEEEAL